MKRSERLAMRAAECAGKGGVAIAAGLAAMTWAALRYLNECWWCVPLGMTAGLLLVLGLCRWVDGSRLYELSLEEEAWEARRMREEDQREL